MYSFSVEIIVLTLFGRFMHFNMHVYFMQSWYFFFLNIFILSTDENNIGAI